MSDLPRSSRLLHQVASRLRVRSFAKWLYLSFLVACGLYAAGLLTSRLLGLIPNWFDPMSLTVIPAAALLGGLLLHRRATPAEAARSVDVHNGTKDLFLTLTMLEDAPGEYGPLVARDAEAKAETVKPVQVVPYGGSNSLGSIAVAIAVLAVAVLYLPQLDPFGKLEAAQMEETEKQELADSRKATQKRAALLKKQDDNGGEDSKEVKKAIEGLKTTFQKAKPTAKKANFKALASHQKSIGDKWRKRAEKLNDLLARKKNTQQFGGVNRENLEKWTKELQEGSTDSLQKELDELKHELKKLTKTKDPKEKAKIARKIRQKLKEMEELASERVNSKELSAALKRAMKQLEMSNKEGLSTEAMKALSESLDLSMMELKEIAQSAKELKSLEEALKVMQMAKRLNEGEKLDGEACENCVSMADYEAMYREMMAGMGEPGDGEGTGNEGMGRGGEVPEDDTAKTGFKTERSKSAVTAGKVLLSLKTKGLSDKGDAVKNYRNQISNVKQGVSEAILQERVPPGYHDGIQKYFDNIDDAAKKPGK